MNRYVIKKEFFDVNRALETYPPIFMVQIVVADGFSNRVALHLLGSFEVGNGAGDFEDVVGDDVIWFHILICSLFGFLFMVIPY